MLERKPRIGETLVNTKGERCTVLGWYKNDPDGDICRIQYDGAKDETLFIWRFHDGLNREMSHAEPAQRDRKWYDEGVVVDAADAANNPPDHLAHFRAIMRHFE